MLFSIRHFRRFPVQGSVTYNAVLLINLPLAYCSSGGETCMRDLIGWFLE
jgi:hypothetical protein